VLLVFGAKAAIEWAAVLRLDRKANRHFAWSEKLVAIEPIRVAADEILADAMYWAAFAEVDAAVTVENFCRHELNGRALRRMRVTAQRSARIPSRFKALRT
jgi:hypothetical protein